jgi:hypothetical protein
MWACIFVLPFLVFIIFVMEWWGRPLRDSRPFASIHGRDSEKLQEEHTIKAHALASQRFLKMAPYFTPPPLIQLHHTRAFAYVGEYVYVVHASAVDTFAAPSVETITTLYHFHPLVKVNLPPSIDITVLGVFVIIRKVWSIKTFTVASEVCSWRNV